VGLPGEPGGEHPGSAVERAAAGRAIDEARLASAASCWRA